VETQDTNSFRTVIFGTIVKPVLSNSREQVNFHKVQVSNLCYPAREFKQTGEF
jgi:hypothetical protein